MTDPLTILQGDALERLRELPAESVQCCVTSPPYFGLRDYGCDGQLGLEATPEAYVARLVEVFREVRRVLKSDGTCWLNIGDSYAAGKRGNASFGDPSSSLNNGGHGTKTGDVMDVVMRKPPQGMKPKDLIGIPWMLAFALRADGWWLRQDIIWAKPNPMPESVTDRCTKAHEYVFLLSKSERYFYNADAIAETSSGLTGGRFGAGGFEVGRLRQDACRDRPNDTGVRNARSVWTIATQPYPDSHFATMPPALAERCILAGTKHGDTVLDPFGGSGTTGRVALSMGRQAILIELNPAYIPMIERRCTVTIGMF